MLTNLEPKRVWEQFEKITKIPRPSKKEEKIIEYLLEFGKKHNLETKRDKIGNVLIKKPATKGYENRKTVILQSHMDMVCEKNSDVDFNFETDAIQAYVDGEWVKARGTTLGADDGIGIAAQLAILTSGDIEHGPIECLFTVDEETGLTGAFALEPDFFSGSILLNLDSEDEGEIFIGCAGGIDTIAKFNYRKDPVPDNYKIAAIDISGLPGGHSGDDIHKEHGNSNKILNRFLWHGQNNYGLRLSIFDGGNLRNAIPREAKAIFAVPEIKYNDFVKFTNKLIEDIKFEYEETAPELNIDLNENQQADWLIDLKTQNNLLNALYACPHGVIKWSMKLKGLVETSTNLASVKFKDDKIIVTTSQRSSLESGKTDIASMVESVFILAGAKVEHTDGYPGWNPNPKSEILQIAVDSYQRLFGNKPVVRAIHAGLECGLFLEKYPNLDMISFGPTLRGVHSPDEKINIKTVEKWWKHLLDILKNIPKTN
ncbi:MAG: aminoacyl-histidine dipeptidase [Marinilabiliales bacterium]